jgi:ATP-dependent protease HslVU (ClpYQ) peptidase subunit
MMAGDKQFSHSGGTILRGKTKIYKLPQKSSLLLFEKSTVFVGFAGNADAFADAIGYLFVPNDTPPKLKGVEMLMLNDSGEIYHGSNFRNWLLIDEPHFAIGSGMQYAIAAMESGKDPYAAVKIASKYDVNTGMGFNKLVMKPM